MSPALLGSVAGGGGHARLRSPSDDVTDQLHADLHSVRGAISAGHDGSKCAHLMRDMGIGRYGKAGKAL